jgi:hypothetical protein
MVTTYKEADGSATFVSEDNPLPVSATIDVGDVDIGAVEIKDATTDNRAKVTNAAPGGSDYGVVVRLAGDAAVTDAQLRAAAVPVSLATTPGLTDTQLRASAVPVDTELPAAAALADVTANPTAPIVGAALHMFNGATWDRVRNNREIVVLASAAQTTTQTGSDMTSYNARGVHFIVHVTTPGTGSITPKLQGKDANGNYYDLLVGPAITAAGTTVLKLGPGITPVANAAAADFLPRTFRTVITANNANSMTYDAALALVV